jgi:hypothetical protein
MHWITEPLGHQVCFVSSLFPPIPVKVSAGSASPSFVSGSSPNERLTPKVGSVSAELQRANVNICANVAEALERAKKLWSLRNEQESESGE